MHGSGMRRKAASGEISQLIPASNQSVQKSSTRVQLAQFRPARDSRNRRVPGLYVRNGRYYCQLWIDPGNGRKTSRRIPLLDENNLPIRTLQAAKEAHEIKRNERRESKLPTPGRKPTLNAFCDIYFEKPKVSRKRAGTLENERQSLARWRHQIGHVRIDQISTSMVTAFVEKRLRGAAFGKRHLDGVAERTANLDLMMLRNVLNAAIDDGLIRQLPRMNFLDEPPTPKRKLLLPDEFESLIKSAKSACERNGDQLADYLQFLAFSGSREKEALRIRLGDVDFERQRVTIGSDGLSKNWKSRTVEFNPKLGALLRDMDSRRPPDSLWLFPSPRRGERDRHAESLRESLKLARKAAKLEWVAFHDLRHYFCSMCVMAGIDFMTIAAWLGHSDGGILVGKVYGHLLDEHRQKAARRLDFSP